MRAAGAAARLAGLWLLALGDLERVAAAARGGHVRVVDREAGLEAVEEVDLGALEVRRAVRIDDDRRPRGASSSWSPSWAPLSNPSAYWKPEQPPPWTATRRTPASPSGSSAWRSRIFAAARSVSVMTSTGRSMISTRLIVAMWAGVTSPDFVTVGAGFVEPFSALLVRRGQVLGSAPGKEVAMLDNWLPFLIYGFFALAIPASMVAMSFAFATRPRAPQQGADASVRVGRVHGPLAAAALHRQLLPDGDAVHRLRHRDRLPVPAGRGAPGARLVRLLGVPRSSSRSWRSRTSTSGARGRSNGSEAAAVARPPPGHDGLQSERLLWPDEGAERLRAGARRGGPRETPRC